MVLLGSGMAGWLYLLPMFLRFMYVEGKSELSACFFICKVPIRFNWYCTQLLLLLLLFVCLFVLL